MGHREEARAARGHRATAGSDIGIVSIGSCDGAIREALDILKAQGVGVDYMRVRAFPFSEDVERFLEAHKLLFVVEQNRDAQFRSLLTLETRGRESQAAFAAALQRLADLLELHRRGSAGAKCVHDRKLQSQGRGAAGLIEEVT